MLKEHITKNSFSGISGGEESQYHPKNHIATTAKLTISGAFSYGIVSL